MMEKTLIVAEKPAQAADFYVPMIERVCPGQKFVKKDGYFESADFYIAWCRGHLLSIMEPAEFDERYKGFGFDTLPIEFGNKGVPLKFTDPGCQKLGQTIARLAQECQTVVCATDPDREGQGIFSQLFNYYKIKRPVMKRLWSPSLTDKDLDKARANMKDLSEYDGLASACAERGKADYLVGMNGSRAYSAACRSKISVGRVQTPVLQMIVKRDYEVENFKESFFWQIRGKWGDILFTYVQQEDGETKFEDEAAVKAVLADIEGEKFKIRKFKESECVENPPKTFSLPSLQKAASKLYKFSAKKTLELTQGLYERKLVTYPRTDSPYLPTSDLAEYHELVRLLATPEQQKYLLADGECPACVKDTDSPHTALIVTNNSAGEGSSLTGDEKKIYDLIREYFVLAFMRPCLYTNYEIELENVGNEYTAGRHLLKATVRVDNLKNYAAGVAVSACGEFGVVDPSVKQEADGVNSATQRGFKDYFKGADDSRDEDEVIGNVEVSNNRLDGDKLNGLTSNLSDIETPKTKRGKPKRYTSGTLITAMQKCGKNVTNPKFKKILSETRGIGTPATQSEFADRLIRSELIEEVSGSYVSTPKGRALVNVLMDELKSPEMTAEWELKLKLIEMNDMAPADFERDLKEFIGNIISSAKSLEGKVIPQYKETNLKCPKCKGIIRESKALFICEHTELNKDNDGKWLASGCGFYVGKNYYKDKDVVNVENLGELLNDWITKKPVTLTSKDGKKYKINLQMNKENYTITTEKKEAVGLGITCPCCGKDIVEREKGYMCSGGRECGVVVWKEISGKKITPEIARELVTKGETDYYSDFKSKAGKSFKAKLVLNRAEKKVELKF